MRFVGGTSIPLQLIFKHGRPAATQNNIKSERPKRHWHRMRHIQPRRYSVNRLWIRDGLNDRAKRNMRVTFKIHLRNQPLRPALAKATKMNMCRPPIIATVLPGIGTRPHSTERKIALLIGDEFGHSRQNWGPKAPDSRLFCDDTARRHWLAKTPARPAAPAAHFHQADDHAP